MVSKANSIYEEFIKNEAPKEVTASYLFSFCIYLKASSTHNMFSIKNLYLMLIVMFLWSQINLDFHTKNAIIQSLHEPTVTSFLAAQRKVYSLMENNSYPRFIHSDLYKELCDAARREGKAH